MKNKLLIFGYGYVAKALSKSILDFDLVSTSRNIQMSCDNRDLGRNKVILGEPASKSESLYLIGAPHRSDVRQSRAYSCIDTKIE